MGLNRPTLSLIVAAVGTVLTVIGLVALFGPAALVVCGGFLAVVGLLGVQV